jgi:hypothetical protein
MPDLSVKVDRHDIVGIGIGLSLVWLLATFTWFFQHLSEANGPRTVGMNFTLPLIYRFEDDHSVGLSAVAPGRLLTHTCLKNLAQCHPRAISLPPASPN